MFLNNIFCNIAVAFVVGIALFVDCNKYERNEVEDILVLNPVELIDLVIEEQKRRGKDMSLPMAKRRLKPELKTDNDLDNVEELRDEEPLNARKIWSRWSKWDGCSVTCGTGTITRRRQCVAGRCAPGEREEQRRPCERTPCARPIAVPAPARATSAEDDSHDLE